jgi:hypothetical protein
VKKSTASSAYLRRALQHFRMAAVASVSLVRPWPTFTASPSIGTLVDSEQAFDDFACDHGPGRDDVDEHSLEPFLGTKVSARAWGKVIHHKDGQVALDPIPWQS